MVRGIEGGQRAARLIKHILEYCRGEAMRVVCEGMIDSDRVRRALGL